MYIPALIIALPLIGVLLSILRVVWLRTFAHVVERHSESRTTLPFEWYTDRDTGLDSSTPLGISIGEVKYLLVIEEIVSTACLEMILFVQILC